MIKINRTPPPVELTPLVVASETAKFKASKAVVWNKPYIKTALQAMSHGKCCYCECDVSTGSSYMEVEHFHDKKTYPNEVLLWGNLLPSCKRCNGKKGTYDTKANPIVNPTVDYPQKHMILKKCFRYKSKDPKGQRTIDALDLNNQERAVTERYQIKQVLTQRLKSIMLMARLIGQGNLVRQISKRLQEEMTQLLQECQSDKKYTAVKVTTVLNSMNYKKARKVMKRFKLWSRKMDTLETRMTSYKYDTV